LPRWDKHDPTDLEEITSLTSRIIIFGGLAVAVIIGFGRPRLLCSLSFLASLYGHGKLAHGQLQLPPRHRSQSAPLNPLEESAGLMARKLKTYQTSLGFFDLAIAAPSMKAALEAWGSKTNLFHQGFAKETDDPAIVAATFAKPGVVLRRPVGSDGTFNEDAELPKNLAIEKVKERPARPRAPTREPPAQKLDDKAAREAALALERERKRRDSERRKEEAAREKERKRREQAIANAETALEEAKRDHEAKVDEIKRDRAALDGRSQAEDERWEKQKEKLETALRRARLAT
jgi:colicin import membrane protein